MKITNQLNIILQVLILVGALNAQSNKIFYLLNDAFYPLDSLLSSKPIVFRSKVFCENDKIRNLVYQKLEKFKNITVNSSEEYLLTVTFIDYKEKFPEIISYPLFGSKKYKRETYIDMAYSLENLTHKELVFFKDYRNIMIDTLSEEDIFNSTQSIPKNSLPDVPLWRNILEPSLISAITGLFVYLFFIVRSR